MTKKMKSKEIFETLVCRFNNFQESYHIKVDTTNHSPIYVGVSIEKKPILIFEIDEKFLECCKELNDTIGYRIFENKKTSNMTQIVLESASDYSVEVFFVLSDDLISIAENSDAPALSVINRLKIWEDFFKHSVNGVISNEFQIGLLGELSYIEEELLNGNISIISQWKGPLKEVKDFIIGDAAIEIKTSIISSANRIRISDENQLDSTGFSSLLLNIRLIVQNQMDGRSLPEYIDSIYNVLMNYPKQIEEFRDKLLHYGYIESMKQKYKKKYEIAESFWYKVEDKESYLFPRITPSSLNSGIKYVQYQIELSSLLPFLVSK